jgi:hypothetical protein
MAAAWHEPDAEEPEILRRVALFGHAEVLKFLIDVVGAPVYKSGDLPGWLATVGRRLPRDLRDELRGAATTPVHCACEGGDADGLRALLDRGANARKPNGSHHSPATLAIVNGSSECVKELWRRKAVPRLKGHRNPVVDAAKFGHLDVLRFLVVEAKFDASGVGCKGETALEAAANGGFWECARFVLRHGKFGLEAVRTAVMSGLDEKFLAEVGQDAALGAALADRLLVGEGYGWRKDYSRPFRPDALNEEGEAEWRCALNIARILVSFSTCGWFRDAVGANGR